MIRARIDRMEQGRSHAFPESPKLTGLHPSPTRRAVAGLGGRAPVGGM
jgi:hypothetical protein